MEIDVIELTKLFNIPTEIVIPIISFLFAFKVFAFLKTQGTLNSPYIDLFHKDYDAISKELYKNGDNRLAEAYYALDRNKYIRRKAKHDTGLTIPNWLNQLGSVTVLFVLVIAATVLLKFVISSADNEYLYYFYSIAYVGVFILLIFVMMVVFICILFDVRFAIEAPERCKGNKVISANHKIAPIISRRRALEIAAIENKYCLVDARSDDEFKNSGLLHAIECKQFIKNVSDYWKYPVFVYSNYGKRSTELVARMKKNGWNNNGVGIYNLGGIQPNNKLFQRLAIELDYRTDLKKNFLGKGKIEK